MLYFVYSVNVETGEEIVESIICDITLEDLKTLLVWKKLNECNWLPKRTITRVD